MKIFIIILFSFLVLSSAHADGARYLIITYDDYYNALLPLAEWKTQKGFKAKIIKLSDIGSDSTQIRSYVMNAYNSWQIKPEYLLLVGNPQQVPFPRMMQYGYVCNSDNYYANVIGDFHNEIIPGRFWVNDSFEAKTVVAKVLGYDKDPYLDGSYWLERGVTIVNEDQDSMPADSVYWADARYTYNHMLNAGFAQIDSFAQSLGHDSTDIINAINGGRSYILYRGVAGGYWDYPFFIRSPDSMFNGFKLPIVISATCATVHGIGQQWLCSGSPEQPKGVVGFLGTTTSLMQAAEMRSALTRGTVESIFCDSLTTLGKATEAGRMRYSALFNDSLEYDSWNCLGDPEMAVWTATPKEIEITHFPPFWSDETLTVNVAYNSMPTESALVCVMAKYDTTVYHYARTNINGEVKFADSLIFPDTALITVTGRNLHPTSVAVGSMYKNGPFVVYRDHLVLDTINGNGNYQPNNGEEIELAVWIINGGDSTAYNASAVLQKAGADSYFQLSDTLKLFGDIASQDSAFTADDGFNITIDQYCPDSHEIDLKLMVRDINDSTWTSYFSILVYSPRPYVIHKSYSVLDTLGGNGNYQVNPGEDVEVAVWVQNIGDSIAENVYGTLREQEVDPYVSLRDTVKYFGDILPMDSTWTGADGFNVVTDSNCPDSHEIKLRIAIKDSLDSLWLYDFSLINLSPALGFYDYLIDDSVKYILHGDTASLVVYIMNYGSATTENITGTLISNDTLLSVLTRTATFGSVQPDSIGSNLSNQFIIVADPATPPGYSTNVELALDAGVYRDTINFNIYTGQRDYLVWDPDPNHSSGFIIHTKLSQLNFMGDYRAAFPYRYLNIYKTLFACCGMYASNFVIYDTSLVASEIEHFLDAGGKMYLEGGDVWYLDPRNGGFDFCPYFGISAIANNIGPFTGVNGVAGTFTQGMSFSYTGENASIDRINAVGSGFSIFQNAFNGNGCGVAANHQTVGLSVELNGLVDAVPPSTKIAFVDSIMQYFGIEPTGAEEYSAQTKVECYSFDVYPNPARKVVNLRYQIPRAESKNNPQVKIRIYNVVGQVVRTIDQIVDKPVDKINWRGEDNFGRTLPFGVYFLKFEAGDFKETKKIIFLR